MENGIVKFPMPKECDPSLRRFIRKMTAKNFESNRNFLSIDEDPNVKDLLLED